MVSLRIAVAELPLQSHGSPFWLCFCAVANGPKEVKVAGKGLSAAVSKASAHHRMLVQSADPNSKNHPPRLPKQRPALDAKLRREQSIAGSVRSLSRVASHTNIQQHGGASSPRGSPRKHPASPRDRGLVPAGRTTSSHGSPRQTSPRGSPRGSPHNLPTLPLDKVPSLGLDLKGGHAVATPEETPAESSPRDQDLAIDATRVFTEPDGLPDGLPGAAAAPSAAARQTGSKHGSSPSQTPSAEDGAAETDTSLIRRILY